MPRGNETERTLHIYREKVESALHRYFPSSAPGTSKVRRAMAYSLFAGGKRIRPVLCLLACKAVGGRIQAALPAACALEFIHTYSLIHDDLPALDDDDYRRGRLTCHRKFGEATAILAGDGLLTEAFALLSHPEVMKTVPVPVRLRVISVIAEAAGIRGMIAGQEADLTAEHRKVSLAFVRLIHRLKTGALIRASLISGGLIGGGGEAEIRALSAFGEKIGLAFQIKDDLLNVEGESRKMGKGTGTDQKRAKATYPAFQGLEASRAQARRLVEEAARDLHPLGDRARDLIRLGDYIIARDR